MKSMMNIRKAVSPPLIFFPTKKFSDNGGKQPCYNEFVNLMLCMSQHTYASISCKGRYESLKLCIERI